MFDVMQVTVTQSIALNSGFLLQLVFSLWRLIRK